jgi:hypothetical protein
MPEEPLSLALEDRAAHELSDHVHIAAVVGRKELGEGLVRLIGGSDDCEEPLVERSQRPDATVAKNGRPLVDSCLSGGSEQDFRVGGGHRNRVEPFAVPGDRHQICEHVLRYRGRAGRLDAVRGRCPQIEQLVARCRTELVALLVEPDEAGSSCRGVQGPLLNASPVDLVGAWPRAHQEHWLVGAQPVVDIRRFRFVGEFGFRLTGPFPGRGLALDADSDVANNGCSGIAQLDLPVDAGVGPGGRVPEMPHAQHDAGYERHALFADDGLIACLLRHRYTMSPPEDSEPGPGGRLRRSTSKLPEKNIGPQIGPQRECDNRPKYT